MSIVLQRVCLITAFCLLATNTALRSAAADDPKPIDEKTKGLLKTFADEFVTITPGKGMFPDSFQMGSLRGKHEQPQHEVTFKYSFAIAKYEVPQDLYEAVMGTNPSRWKGPRNSVELMSWKDANDFCEKVTLTLRQQKLLAENEVIRLPSEAEWEYCCRAGTKTQYSFGDEADNGKDAVDVILTSLGNNQVGVIKIVRDQTGLGEKEAAEFAARLPKPLKVGVSKEEAAKLIAELEAAGGIAKTRKAILLDQYGWHTGNAAGNDPPVGALKPNPWGLYDMHGYLWEFTADAWADNYEGAPVDGSAAKATSDNHFIVLRSGSWKDKYDFLTSGARRKYPATDADDAVGFRCVKAKTN